MKHGVAVLTLCFSSWMFVDLLLIKSELKRIEARITNFITHGDPKGFFWDFFYFQMDRIQDHNFLNWLINVLMISYAGFFFGNC